MALIKEIIKYMRVGFRARSFARIGWGPIIKKDIRLWESEKSKAKNGKKVLIATSLGGYDSGAYLESILAVALTLRGAETEILLCDKSLPACQMAKLARVKPTQFAEMGPSNFCGSCLASGLSIYKPLGLKIHLYSNHITEVQQTLARKIAQTVAFDEISTYKFDGLAVGEHAYAGALRYFARGDLLGELEGEAVLRCYLEAAIRTVFVTRSLIKENNISVVVFHHGIYVPQGIIGEVCRHEGIRVVNSNPAYRKQTFIFSHNDTYHHTMIDEPVSTWEDIRWDASKKAKVLEYLSSRWYGTNDWIWFHEPPKHDINEIAAELKIDFSRPTIGLLTSVMWDAQLHYRSNAFKNMIEWVMATIRYFETRPDLQLLIRIHPAEVTGLVPSRQLMTTEISRHFPSIPKNVFIIKPESTIGTYAAMNQCDSVVIYNTKMGIELSAVGIPVVVAGEAWIRNKGFSIDITSPEQYVSVLDGLPLGRRMNDSQINRAQKYAFHFFFRRMIDLRFIESEKKFEFKLAVDSIESLCAGHNSGLDCICSGILDGTHFTMDTE